MREPLSFYLYQGLQTMGRNPAAQAHFVHYNSNAKIFLAGSLTLNMKTVSELFKRVCGPADAIKI